MSAAGERQRAKDRRTSERSGPKARRASRAPASDGGGRRTAGSFITDASKAARRRAIAERRQRTVYPYLTQRGGAWA